MKNNNIHNQQCSATNSLLSQYGLWKSMKPWLEMVKKKNYVSFIYN